MLIGKLRFLVTIFFAIIVFLGCESIRTIDRFGGPYTITFLDYDETVLKTQVITSLQDVVIPPEAPEKEGYTFTGWSASFEEVASDLIVYAEYSLTVYGIIYHLNLGEFEAAYPTKYTIETETFDLIVPTKVGHTFDGWYDEASEGQLVNNVPLGSYGTLELYARWLINQYDVVYYEEDGVTIIQTISYEYGTDLTGHIEPDSLEKEGHTFNGWIALPQTMPASDVIRTASYTINSYLVIYYEEDGVTIIESTRYEYGADLSNHIEPFAPIKISHKFDGWITLPATMPAGDVIRVATFTFDSNDPPIYMGRVGEEETTYLFYWTN